MFQSNISAGNYEPQIYPVLYDKSQIQPFLEIETEENLYRIGLLNYGNQ